MSDDMKKMAEQLEALTQRVAELERDKVPMEMKIVDPRLGRDFPLPEFATPGSAAIDLRAMMDNNIILAPGEFQLIPSGIAVNMPSAKYCATILPRSGLGAKHGLVLRNLVGLIDSDYQGQILMSIVNNGSQPFEINVGDRIAQLKFALVVHPEFNIVTEFKESTDRGDGGFGHSGRR